MYSCFSLVETFLLLIQLYFLHFLIYATFLFLHDPNWYVDCRFAECFWSSPGNRNRNTVHFEESELISLGTISFSDSPSSYINCKQIKNPHKGYSSTILLQTKFYSVDNKISWNGFSLNLNKLSKSRKSVKTFYWELVIIKCLSLACDLCEAS